MSLAGCGGTEPSAAPPTPAFGPPILIPAPVSTSGWEDSGYITPDGATLYFTYLRIDPVLLITQGIIRVIGPARPGWPTTSPFDTLGAEIYVSHRVGATWDEPTNLGLPINRPEDLEGDEWVSEDGARILFTNGVPGPGRPEHGIYFAAKQNGVWSTPVLARDVGYPFVAGDENPHLTADERTLFWESSRPGGYGEQDLWMSEKTGAAWSTPKNLGATINTAGVEGSPWSLDGRELYFDDKGNGIGISWSYRLPDGSWSPRRVVVAGTFGDPSLTRAGDLYAVAGTVVDGIADANLVRFDRLR